MTVMSMLKFFLLLQEARFTDESFVFSVCVVDFIFLYFLSSGICYNLSQVLLQLLRQSSGFILSLRCTQAELRIRIRDYSWFEIID